jgi:hypothetical protein
MDIAKYIDIQWSTSTFWRMAAASSDVTPAHQGNPEQNADKSTFHDHGIRYFHEVDVSGRGLPFRTLRPEVSSACVAGFPAARLVLSRRRQCILPSDA